MGGGGSAGGVAEGGVVGLMVRAGDEGGAEVHRLMGGVGRRYGT